VAPAAVLASVWQWSKQAVRIAAQSTAMAGAVASSIKQAPMRTVRVAFNSRPVKSGLGLSSLHHGP
jgi:hypothetical protein